MFWKICQWWKVTDGGNRKTFRCKGLPKVGCGCCCFSQETRDFHEIILDPNTKPSVWIHFTSPSKCN